MQELLVVRHEDDRARECCERTLERFDRAHIKMVRRLIEDEQVRFSQQLLGDEQLLQLSRADVRPLSQCIRITIQSCDQRKHPSLICIIKCAQPLQRSLPHALINLLRDERILYLIRDKLCAERKSVVFPTPFRPDTPT